MPGWKFVIGGGEKIKNQEPRNQSDTRNESNAGSGGGNAGMSNNSNGVQGGNAGAQMNSTYYPPQQNGQPNMYGRGQSPMSMNNFAMGYYEGGNMAGGYGGYNLRNAQMGYIVDEPENRGGGRGRGTRAEEDSYEPEARRGRSRRTGRFVHRAEAEGQMEMEARSRGRDEEDEDREERSGSYSRREHEDGEVQRLHKKIKKLEQRLEEGEEAQEHVRHLKKEVKRLKEALEEIKEERGKEGGEDREKRDKKKKERGKDEEEDDEDDPLTSLHKLLKEGVSGKEFLKHLPRIFHEAFGVIADPPQTWPPYLEKGDFSGIYTMEAKELMKAIEQYKAGQKGVDDVLKEMKHTGAALIQMYANLLQQMEEKK